MEEIKDDFEQIVEIKINKNRSQCTVSFDEDYNEETIMFVLFVALERLCKMADKDVKEEFKKFYKF